LRVASQSIDPHLVTLLTNPAPTSVDEVSKCQHHPRVDPANRRNAIADTHPQEHHSNKPKSRMSSFINTMFVHNSPPQPYSQSPQPLAPLHSNVLAESESYIHIHPPTSPQETYKSPLQRHLHNALSDSPNSASGIPAPVHTENRTHDVQRGYRGLGHGLKDIAQQADLLTYSNNNARTRNTAFQPQKRAKGTNSWQLKQFAEATLGSGSLRKVVQLPEGEDRDEWLAVNGNTIKHHHSTPRSLVY